MFGNTQNEAGRIHKASFCGRPARGGATCKRCWRAGRRGWHRVHIYAAAPRAAVVNAYPPLLRRCVCEALAPYGLGRRLCLRMRGFRNAVPPLQFQWRRYSTIRSIDNPFKIKKDFIGGGHEY